MISNLEGRLITRMEWGMIADISSPDLETRLAILQMKCREKNFFRGWQCLAFYRGSYFWKYSRIRRFLNRLTAYHEIRGSQPNLESAKTLLASMYPQQQTSGLTPKRSWRWCRNIWCVIEWISLGKAEKKSWSCRAKSPCFIARDH